MTILDFTFFTGKGAPPKLEMFNQFFTGITAFSILPSSVIDYMFISEIAYLLERHMPETPTFSEKPFRTCQVCRIVFNTIEEKEEHTKSEHS